MLWGQPSITFNLVWWVEMKLMQSTVLKQKPFDLWPLIVFYLFPTLPNLRLLLVSGADPGGGCRGCAPPPPWEKTVWFIGVEVEQETSTPPPKKNPGSAPKCHIVCMTVFFFILTGLLYFWVMVCCPWWWYKLLQPSQLNHRYEMQLSFLNFFLMVSEFWFNFEI